MTVASPDPILGPDLGAGPQAAASAGSFVLHGTPVVPGVSHAPVVVATSGLSRAAVDAFDSRTFANEAAALDAYDAATSAVAGRLADRAATVAGPAAEVLAATAGLVRDKGLRSAVTKRLRAGDSLLSALQGAVDEFAGVFTQMGGLMAERVTDLHDIETRVTAALVGEPEPGVPTPLVPSVLVAEDLAPAEAAALDVLG